MSGTTSVPSIVFGPTGPVAPTQSAIVAGLVADWTAAFNGNLNTAPGTPAAQLIASQAAMLGDCYDQMALLFQGMDPAYAAGRQQDGIGLIYFLERYPGQSTVLQIACGGAVGVPIPVGASVKDQPGNIYLCTQAGEIPSSGTITLAFASVLLAPVPVPPTVSIYQTISLWNTATVISGVVGSLVETRSAFETRREATVAANGAGFLNAISGAVAKVPGVIDYYATENDTASPVTVQGVSIAAYSIYVAVAGGAAANVAQALFTKKNPGPPYTGNTSFSVYDTNSGYSMPYPGPYVITWETPIAAPICILVTMTNSPGVPSTALAMIQAACQVAFLGQDGGPRARIGAMLYALRYAAGIAALGTWAQTISIQIGTDAIPGATFTGSISNGSGAAGTTLAVSSVTGTIAIGQFVYGAGVAAATIITAGSGSSWTVSMSQLVPATSTEAMSSVAANQNDLTMQINWIPTLAVADVNLVLV